MGEPGLLPLRIYLGGRPFILQVADLFRKVPARDGGELCMLQIQPNGMAPSGTADAGGLLGDLLGGLLSSSRAPTMGTGPSSNSESLDGLLDSIFGSGPSLRSRRLQYSQPASIHDPSEDLWMIGGVFLERFVTIFDFDNGRLGFAQPSAGVVPLTPSRLNAALPNNASVEGELRIPKQNSVGGVMTLDVFGLTGFVA